MLRTPSRITGVESQTALSAPRAARFLARFRPHCPQPISAMLDRLISVPPARSIGGDYSIRAGKLRRNSLVKEAEYLPRGSLPAEDARARQPPPLEIRPKGVVREDPIHGVRQGDGVV